MCGLTHFLKTEIWASFLHVARDFVADKEKSVHSCVLCTEKMGSWLICISRMNATHLLIRLWPGFWLFACSNLLPIFLVAVILCALCSVLDNEYALFRAMAYLFFVCSHGCGLIMFCLVRTGALFLYLSSFEAFLPGSLTHGLVHQSLFLTGLVGIFLLY